MAGLAKASGAEQFVKCRNQFVELREERQKAPIAAAQNWC
jgi:hypothetical protein